MASCRFEINLFKRSVPETRGRKFKRVYRIDIELQNYKVRPCNACNAMSVMIQ